MVYKDNEQPALENVEQPPVERAAVPASLLPSVLSGLGLGDRPTAQGDEHEASLKDKERSMRVATVRRAGEHGEAASLDFLVSALHDPAWEVRAAAVWALSTCGEQAPVEALCNALADED